MSNVSAIGYEKYEPARQVDKASFTEHVVFLTKSLWVFIKSFLCFLPEIIGIAKSEIFGKRPKDVKGHLALVTGSANGLGKEISIELAKKGCNIAVVDLDFENAEITAREIAEKYNVKTKAFRVDIAKYEEVLQMKEDIESNLGFVDILVNNAGLMPFVSLREGTHEDIQKIIDVNLTSQFWTCRLFLNGMIHRKRGHIVTISSLAGLLAIPRSCGYSATKYGVRGLMNALYFELCADGHEQLVNLSSVFPCFIKTRKDIDTILDSTGALAMPLDPNNCAKDIVHGILRNKDQIILPKYFSMMTKVAEWIPKEYWKHFMKNAAKNASFKFMDNGI